MKYLFFKIACAIFLFSEVSAQQLVVPANLYGIRNPGKEIDKFCSSCTKFMETLPKEVGYGLSVDPNNDVYFVFTDVDYFNKLFASPTDGLAVDIILRDQYSCKGPTKTSGSWLYRGYLPKPVYQAELKANKTVTKEGYVYVKLFKLPKQFLNKEIELNLILLKNKYFCWYNTFYNLESGHWGLLDMGMYMDTLSEQSLKEKSNVLGKRLNFEVPFAKDKAEYAAKDIKPLYDSLKLTNFDIKSISIRAYSSVEGTTERNLQLQQKRAESIVKALQTLQSVQLDSIKTEIIVSENWVEFYEDIIDGKFSDMSGLSKDEIKLRLNTDKALSASMEPILKKHRKAIIILELEPKSNYKDKDPAKLKASFDQSIANKNITEALAVQKEIFRRVLYHQAPEGFIEKLEVPEQLEFGLLKNNMAAFKYQENVIDLFETLKQFKRMEDIMPSSHRIKYNICVLELKGWLSAEITVDPADLYQRIQDLNKTTVDKRLVKRMLINYHIINSEVLMAQRKYQEKDKSLKFISDNYTFLNLSDQDLLSLAQYFVEFGHSDWSRKFLYQYVKKLGASEDLLFYYLNLTITRSELNESKDYNAIMLNAINVNRQRYCNLFNTSGKDGGITFQLLENDYLKRTYCDNCAKK